MLKAKGKKWTRTPYNFKNYHIWTQEADPEGWGVSGQFGYTASSNLPWITTTYMIQLFLMVPRAMQLFLFLFLFSSILVLKKGIVQLKRWCNFKFKDLSISHFSFKIRKSGNPGPDYSYDFNPLFRVCQLWPVGQFQSTIHRNSYQGCPCQHTS